MEPNREDETSSLDEPPRAKPPRSVKQLEAQKKMLDALAAKRSAVAAGKVPAAPKPRGRPKKSTKQTEPGPQTLTADVVAVDSSLVPQIVSKPPTDAVSSSQPPSQSKTPATPDSMLEVQAQLAALALKMDKVAEAPAKWEQKKYVIAQRAKAKRAQAQTEAHHTHTPSYAESQPRSQPLSQPQYNTQHKANPVPLRGKALLDALLFSR